MGMTDFVGPDYSLKEFSETNWKRCVGPFKCGDKDNGYWFKAMIEELGEMAGAAKKLERGFTQRELLKMAKRDYDPNITPEQLNHLDFPIIKKLGDQWKKEQKGKLSKEAADLFTYLELFCTKNGINLWEAVREKFNQVSEEMNCPQYKI